MPVLSNNPDFFAYDGKDKAELIEWLKRRGSFNFGHFLRNDKRGCAMVALKMDWKPESDWSIPEKRGVIIMSNVKGTEEANKDAVEPFIKWLADWARSNGNYMGY